MKSLRVLFSVVVLSLSTMAFAQMDAAKSDAPKSDAQKSFDQLKTLAGAWQGPVTTVPPDPGMGNGASMQVSMRVTSRGNSLVHEMMASGTPDDLTKNDPAKNDPTKNDHPVTMFYLDNDRLLLTHYCDAGNRPRMTARTSPDGKTLEFDFLDVSGDVQYGHMQHVVITLIDENHHTEDWTFLMPGDKLMRGHMDLQRTK
jgi:hypothetical protein